MTTLQTKEKACLSRPVRTFLHLARAYTKKYPHESFLFDFDGHLVSVGDAPDPARVGFTDSQHIIADILAGGSIPQGEAYCDGHIRGDRESLTRYLEMMLRVSEEQDLRCSLSWLDKVNLWRAIRRSAVSSGGRGPRENVQAHYSMENWFADLDDANAFFLAWLGKYPLYTCGLWHHGAKTLDEAQLHKMQHYAELLELKPGMRLLDLGCGWGVQGLHYARKYGVDATLVTLSSAQAKYVHQQIQQRRRSDKVRVLVMDVMQIDQLKEPYDCITALGLVEHLGDAQRDELFGKAAALLKPDGRAIWHTMFNRVHHDFDAWCGKYVWPGIRIPSQEKLLTSLNRHYRHVRFTPYPYRSYTRTFRCWAKTFFAKEDALREIASRAALVDPEWVIRAFKWYLMCCSIVYNVYMDVGFALVDNRPDES